MKPRNEFTVTPLAYSVDDAAKALGIGRTFMYRLLNDGKLKCIKLGGRTLVPVKEIEVFLSMTSNVT